MVQFLENIIFENYLNTICNLHILDPHITYILDHHLSAHNNVVSNYDKKAEYIKRLPINEDISTYAIVIIL